MIGDKNNTIERLHWELIQREVFEREDGFEAFCNGFGYEPAPHHKLIISKLERCMLEPGYKVIIQAPPGHAKSTYSSVLAPAYFLGRFPKRNIILTGHTLSLVKGFGRKSRNIIQDPKYETIFKTSLTKSSKASHSYQLTNGSCFYASGVRGNITGNRSTFTIIDDPIRGYQDSDSITIRDAVYEAFINDIMTRIIPGQETSYALVQTRWHEDDLAGRILNSPGGKQWEVVSLPAFAQENDILGRSVGEPLWPQGYPKKTLMDLCESLGGEKSRSWLSLFQQSPSSEEGSYFLSEWLQFVDEVPDNLMYYGGSDYAVTDGGGDYTVHIVVGYDRKKDNLYVVDIWRGQSTSNVWIDAFLDLSEKYKPRVWAEENGQIIQSLGPYIEKEMSLRRFWVNREQYTSSKDKPTRARSIQGLLAKKKVFILNHQKWTSDFVAELLKFPTGMHDDQVDALSVLGRLIENMRISIERPKEKYEYEYESGKILLPDWMLDKK